MQESLVCILEAGSLPVEDEKILASAGLTLRYGNTLGGPGCLLFSQDGTVAFLNAAAGSSSASNQKAISPSFDPALVHKCERAAKTYRQATLLLPNTFLGSQELLHYHRSLSHLDNFTLCLMPMGADFATHAMETAHAFFQGLANYPAWRSAQTDLVCSSKAAARILSALPLGDDHVGSATSSSSEILEDSLHRARMLRMELGSLAALSRATAAQLQAAARISTEAAENLQKFLTSKPCSIS